MIIVGSPCHLQQLSKSISRTSHRFISLGDEHNKDDSMTMDRTD